MRRNNEALFAVVVAIIFLVSFIVTIIVINDDSNQYVKCRESGGAPDICFFGGDR